MYGQEGDNELTVTASSHIEENRIMCICTSPKLSDDKDRNLIVKVFLKMVHVIYSHIITPQESSF